MVSIGIFSPDFKAMISRYLQLLFASEGKKYVSLFHAIDNDALHCLTSADIDYFIIDLETVAYDFVDILICDCEGTALSEINRHICPSTRLIYNIDSGFVPASHQNTISCGLSQQAAATVSSVSDDEFIFCLQKPITTLFGKQVGESEFLVRPPQHHTELESALPAVACGILCEAIKIESASSPFDFSQLSDEITKSDALTTE